MTQKLHANLSQKCKLLKTADQVKEQEEEVSNKKQISTRFNFKKILTSAKISTSMTDLWKWGNSWIYFILLNLLISYILLRRNGFLKEHVLSRFFCFFFTQTSYIPHITSSEMLTFKSSHQKCLMKTQVFRGGFRNFS